MGMGTRLDYNEGIHHASNSPASLMDVIREIGWQCETSAIYHT